MTKRDCFKDAGLLTLLLIVLHSKTSNINLCTKSETLLPPTVFLLESKDAMFPRVVQRQEHHPNLQLLFLFIYYLDLNRSKQNHYCWDEAESDGTYVTSDWDEQDNMLSRVGNLTYCVNPN